MRRLSGYPRWFYSALIAASVGLLASGILLIPTMMDLRLDMEPPVQIPGDLRLTGAAIHCLIAFITIGMVGALATVHMRSGWRRKLNRVSGILLLLLFSFLLLSGTGIYYFGDPELSQLSSLTHTIAGAIIAVLFTWHLAMGLRIRRLAKRNALTQ
ncbi:hypothetical protein [Microbulbifer variabilis]|uniref:hypothetical protein n=1 Tax=Microbulbifer variabilis TaxID=266805 RepID=UPI001CFEA863|nr:hypothetical protein [Microbulbifer variabilis]